MSLNNVGKIIRKDMASAVKNPAVIIALIVIIILPSCYALLNIQACWDPYGSTENLEFAVVNNDENFTYNGQEISAGQEVVDELKNNSDFNWTFVNENNARQGVENGSYVAAIIIPENFSEGISSINSLEPAQSNLTYLINEKNNPVASRMTNNAVDKIQSIVNDNVVQRMDMVAFEQLATMGAMTQQQQLMQLSMVNESGVENYFYSPVVIEREEINSVENYGSELSPFYIILSIWIGCIISAAMIKTRYLDKSLFSPLELYTGRMVLFILIGLLQSTVTLIGAFSLGIQVNNVGLFIASVYFISIVLTVLIYSLVSVLGNAGKVIAILLLVLQISTTNGIYPVEVMDPILQTLNPYLPMTYAIDMLREALLGVYWPTFNLGFYSLLALLIATLIIAVIVKEKFNEKANKFESSLKDSGLF